MCLKISQSPSIVFFRTEEHVLVFGVALYVTIVYFKNASLTAKQYFR